MRKKIVKPHNCNCNKVNVNEYAYKLGAGIGIFAFGISSFVTSLSKNVVLNVRDISLTMMITGLIILFANHFKHRKLKK